MSAQHPEKYWQCDKKHLLCCHNVQSCKGSSSVREKVKVSTCRCSKDGWTVVADFGVCWSGLINIHPFHGRSEDPHIMEGFFKISLRNDHNHQVSYAEALKNRHVWLDTSNKLQALFQNGHSPSSALDTLKFDLQEQEGENYIYTAVDRSACPDLQFCYRWGVSRG